MRRKMMWASLIFLFLLLLIPSFSFEQSNQLKADTTEVYRLIEQAEDYISSDSDSAQMLLHNAIKLSEELAFPKGKIRALEALGDWYVNQQAFDAALIEYQHIIDIQEALGDQLQMGHTLAKMANAAEAAKDYEGAKAYFEKSYASFQIIDDKIGMATACSNRGLILFLEGDYKGAEEAQEEAFSLFMVVGDIAGECMALKRKAVVFNALGELAMAKKLLQKVLRIARQAEYREGVYNAAINLADILIREGHHKDAQTYMDEALLASDGASGNTQTHVAILYTQGDIFRLQGRYEKALGSYFQARKKAEEINFTIGLPHIDFQLGQVHLFLGDGSAASNYFEPSLQLARANKDVRGEAKALYYMGMAKEKQNDWEAALQYYEECLALGQKIQFEEQIVNVQNQLGQFYKREGLFDKSLEYYEQSLIVLGHHADFKDKVIVYNLLGELYVEVSNFDEAFHYFNLAKDLLDESANIDLKSSTLFHLGDAYNAQGNLIEAEKNYLECLQLLEQIGKVSTLPQVSNRLGKFYLEQERYQEALPLLKKGLEISQQIKDELQEAEANLLLGRLFLQLLELQAALDHALQASNFELLPYQLRANKLLADIYSHNKDYKAAYVHQQRFSSLSDSLSKEENARILERELAEMEAIRNLEVSQKEKQVQLYLIWALLAIGLAALFGVYTFYNNSKKNKQIANKELAFRQMRDHLFANISHDFRTPLTVLKHSLDEMRKGTLKGSYIDSAEMLYRNTDNLTRLTNQMLDLARMSEGRMQLNPILSNLNETLRLMLLPLSSLSQAKQIHFQLKVPVKQASFLFDPDALGKVIQNLVYNAIKFTPKGGRLDVILNMELTHWTIQVADTGPGISADLLPKIFDRYYRSSSHKGETGGLGLSLAKQLVELAGGSIEVESELGKGTSFWVHWPHGVGNFPREEYLTTRTEIIGMREGNEKAEDLSLKAFFSPEQLLKQTDSSAPRVLIAEDDPDLNILLYQQLSEEYRVIRAFDGKEALELIEKEAPDLILTDIMMPEVDGIQLVEQIMANHEYSHLPIIVLSALEQDIEDMKLWREGVVDFVRKPYDIDILRHRIANQLRLRHEFRAHLSKEGWKINSLADAPLSSMDKEFLERLINCFETNLDEVELGVEQLGKLLGMSRTNLYNKVKSLTGYSPSVFLRKYRMNRAKELLSYQVGNITEVAFQVGYSNLSQFSRIFKEEFGTSPSSLRKDLKTF